ncbi:phosphoribosylglycinamide formyltransferase-1 [Dysgonomonas sp. PH5-45]|uniref:phosphoribosylglycinamide formyltransferase n=1 Tax=unclassified Dysgonomonas TaxID=2630389 RepID=UPI0024758826|nr:MULTISPECIES: phosphoribosylglycinamide formyltransferase [unclassified Dysgonomonas]MDH6355682.1 phosphoribosylglycinamide formyltransferase-1 [Dysgonomonas sp. PH5-45]MDH6388579.1 phosphoribosylglycinamide formyltransferase-1 [Dysgonomonas sp. PH5-37]
MSNIAIFASGSGSNAENIVRFFENDPDISISIIVSNKPDAYVHQRAKKLGVPSVTFSKSDFDTTSKVLDLMTEHHIDLIVLAGFLIKVPANLIEAYPHSIVNIHPALLPKFGGKGMYGDNVHKAVVEAKETETGITIHHVNSNYDEGDIIFQSKCKIDPNDNPDMVAAKVHELEYEYFPQIIKGLLK